MLVRMAAGMLRRDRAVALTLAGLLALSALLACAGAGLMARLVGAGDALLDRADAPHLVQMHTGDLDPAAIDAFAASQDAVTAHRISPLLGIDGAELLLDGRSQEGSVQENSLTVPDPERDLLLDLEDRPVTAVARGQIWLPLYHRLETGLEVGSTVTILAPDGFRRDLEVAGFFRDSTMNTAIAGSKRLAVHRDDLADIAAHTGTPEQLISFWVEDPAARLPALRTAYQEAGLPSAGPMVDRSAFALFAIIAEGLVGAVVLAASLLVLVVGLLCLRLAVRTALERNRREIAVLRAIGVSSPDVRRLHLLTYALIAVPAALAGLLAGTALAPVLSADLVRYTGHQGGPLVLLVPAAVAALLVASVLATVALQLRALLRREPAEDLRAGARTARPGRLRLHRSPLPVGPSLGVMALLRRGGGAPLLAGVFAVCAVLVMLPAAMASTLAAPQLSAQLGFGDGDVRIDLRHSGPADAARFETAEQLLADDPRIASHTALVSTRHLVEGGDGVPFSLPVAGGDHGTSGSGYAQGRPPAAADEIALSLTALAETGRDIGDTLPVQADGTWQDLRIVGSYQDVTYGGITARAQLPVEGEQVLWYVLGAELLPGADGDAVLADLAGALPGARVSDTVEYRAQLLGPIAERMDATARLAIAVSLALAMLFAAMVTRLWLAAEAGEIAIRSALGATPAGLRAPYLTRVLLALAAGTVLGAVLAPVAGRTLLNALLEVMTGGVQALFSGTSRLDLVIDPLGTLVGLPLALAAAVVAATLLTTHALRTVHVRTVTAD